MGDPALRRVLPWLIAMNMYVVLSRKCKTRRAQLIAEETAVVSGNLPLKQSALSSE